MEKATENLVWLLEWKVAFFPNSTISKEVNDEFVYLSRVSKKSRWFSQHQLRLFVASNVSTYVVLRSLGNSCVWNMPTAKNFEGARFWRNILPRSAWVRLSGTGIRFVWRRWTARRRRRGAPNRSCSRITRSILSSYSPVSLPSRRPDLHSSHTRIWNVLSKWLLRQDVRNFLDTTFSYNLHFPSLRFFFHRLSFFSTSTFFFFFFFLIRFPVLEKTAPLSTEFHISPLWNFRSSVAPRCTIARSVGFITCLCYWQRLDSICTKRILREVCLSANNEVASGDLLKYCSPVEWRNYFSHILFRGNKERFFWTDLLSWL